MKKWPGTLGTNVAYSHIQKIKLLLETYLYQ